MEQVYNPLTSYLNQFVDLKVGIVFLFFCFFLLYFFTKVKKLGVLHGVLTSSIAHIFCVLNLMVFWNLLILLLKTCLQKIRLIRYLN